MELKALLERISVYPSMGRGNLKLIILLGLFGDLDSFEFIQIIKINMSKLQSMDLNLIVIGIGDEKSRNEFCNYTGFPVEFVKYDKDASLHQKIGCSSGLNMKINPLANLILMCAGVKSPGTLKEVIRGYIGDKQSDQIYQSKDQIKLGILPKFKGSLFENAGGTGFLRPFEMATLRLENMIEVLCKWNVYMSSSNFLTQRGGTFLFDRDDKLLYRYLPVGLLTYSENMKNPIGFLDSYIVKS